MCGIAGLWSVGLPQPEGERVLRSMTDAIAHRGPDGEGHWFDAPSGLGFGHRRLSIVDLSPTGRQPMTSASGRFVITFNGEVYNYRELRARLEREGHAPAWRGSSDTEVMLAAIDAWGLDAAVREFVGMFAFALWDTREHTLSLVRDRLGVKPLFFAQTPRGLAFGSELKAVRRFPSFDDTIDRGALAHYVRTSCVGGSSTIFRGATRVSPGTIVRFTAPHATPRSDAYWSAADMARAGVERPFSGDANEALVELDALLRDSVRLRMVSDVPLGAFLSGGIDSSLVVSVMQSLAGGRVHTFSIGNENAAFDEAPAARAMAQHLGTRHTELTVTGAHALELIPKLATMFDEPFADSSQLPTALVCALARKDVTVALSGDGGDELFGGYSRHVWSPRLWSGLRHVPSLAKRGLSRAMRQLSPSQWDNVFRALPSRLPKPRLPGLRLHKLAGALPAASPTALYAALSSHWGPEVLREPASEHASPSNPMSEADVASMMMFADLVEYLPDDILTKVDRASMAVSLEAREPLLDHRLAAFAWSLPLEFKVRGSTGKWLLRELLAKYVPRTLVSGPKMGFAVPLGDWLRGPLREWAEDLLSEHRLRDDGAFNVELVRTRWAEHLRGTAAWEFHLWDVLIYNQWLRAR